MSDETQAVHNRPAPPSRLDLQLQRLGMSSRYGSTYSNFYTPKNDVFYADCPYSELDATRREIRLLRVFPRRSYAEHLKANPHWPRKDAREDVEEVATGTNGSDAKAEDAQDADGPVTACEMIDNVPLSRFNSEYCAISYCAGDPIDTAVMLVNGVVFNAFANLEHAISCAQHAWETKHPGQEFLVWADQICINQRNHAERSDQVQLMREIYRRSDETFVCLSTPARTDLLDWVPPQLLQSQKCSSSDVLSDFRSHVRSIFSFESDIVEYERWMHSLESFVNSKWWRRSWVYQEFIVSPRPSFISGFTIAPWPQLHALIESTLPRLSEIFSELQASFAAGAPEHEQKSVAIFEAVRAYTKKENKKLKEQYETALQAHRQLTAQLQAERNLGHVVQKHFLRYIGDQDQAGSLMRMRQGVAYSIEGLNSEKTRVNSCQQRVDNYRNQVALEAATPAIDTDGPPTASPPGTNTKGQINAGDNSRETRTEAQVRLHDAEKELFTAEEALREVERAAAQDWRYVALMELPVPDLIVALHGREESEHCANVRWTDIEWLVKGLCYSRHCAVNNYPYRFEDNPDLWGYHQHTCRCIARWNCYDGLATMKDSPIIAKPESYWEPLPDPPKPPELDPEPPREDPSRHQNAFNSIKHRVNILDWSAMQSVADGKQSLRRLTDLKAVLRHSRNCLSSDPRDRIYAFLGLADKAYAIVPDYTAANTVVHELVNTAQKIIAHEQSLDILYSASLGRQSLGSFLPTWVPDWTSTPRQCNLSKFCHALRRGDERPFQVLKQVSFEVSYRTDETKGPEVGLNVRGFMLDTLCEVEEFSKTFPDVATFKTVRGLRIATSRALVDDEVWILDGASMPLILRPEENDDYGFVKEAILLGIGSSISPAMYGNIAETEDGRTAKREVWLI